MDAMPASIPTWWLVLSGLFFFVNIAFYVVLGLVAWKFLGIAQRLEPKIAGLLGKVDDIGTKIDELTAIARDVAAKVGEQAKGVSASANQMGMVAAKSVEKFGPTIAAAATVIKVMDSVRHVLFFRAISRAERRGIEKRASKGQ